MTTRMQGLLFFALLIALLSPTDAIADADPFYMQRLDTGRRLQQAGRNLEAATDLRIAAFGFLDHPDLLTEALARLAVAQQAAGLDEAARQTVSRFAEIESASLVFDAVTLDPPTKRAFDGLLLANLRNERLREIPTLKYLYVSDESRILALPPRQRREALERAVEQNPDNIRWYVLLAREADERNSERDVNRWVTRGLEVDPTEPVLAGIRVERLLRNNDCRAASQVAARAPAIATNLLEGILLCMAAGDEEGAREALASLDARGATLSPQALRIRGELAQPVRSPEPAAEGTDGRQAEPVSREPEPAPETPSVVHPSLPAARQLMLEGRIEASKSMLAELSTDPSLARPIALALLEIGVLTRDWKLAREQLSTIKPLKTSETAAIFYTAVTLYESGRYSDAKRLFEKVRDRIGHNEMVDRYERLIMAQ